MEQVVLVERPTPRVLLMGSSRMLYGPHEDDFAEFANLDATDIANVGVIGSTAHEALWLLQRNPGVTERLDLVVYEVNRLTLRQDKVRPSFYRMMTLHDRLHLDRMSQRIRALADWGLRIRADKRTLMQWLTGIKRLLLGLDPLGTYKVRELWWSDEDRESAALLLSGPKVAVDYLSGFRPSPSAQEATDRLIDYCQEKEIPIVMLVSPSSEAFRNGIPGVPGGEAVEPAWMAWVAHLEQQVPVIRFETAQSLDLGEDVFIDWAHMERVGAREFAKRLVEALRERELLPE